MGDENEDEVNGFDFRLFSSASTAGRLNTEEEPTIQTRQSSKQDKIQSPNLQVQRIRLSTPEDEATTSNTTLQKLSTSRPLGYYFAQTPTAEQQAKYVEAAIAGETVKRISKVPSPGLSKPWRVTVWSQPALNHILKVNNHNVPTAIVLNESESKQTRRRSRMGKKSRIKMRQKMQALQGKEEASRADREAKELALKEKNRRLNRKKQLRRREKAREKRKADTSNEVDGLDESEPES